MIVCSILEQQERGFSLGAADYVLKPILGDDLLNALNRLNGDGRIREVLVVDDDPDALRLMQKIFQQQRALQDHLGARRKGRLEDDHWHPPDAVILDLFMPDLDGFTMLEQMRENARLRDMPVIVVSGGDLTPEQRKQLTEFGQRLISKGALNEKDLLSTVERALKRVETR